MDSSTSHGRVLTNYKFYLTSFWEDAIEYARHQFTVSAKQKDGSTIKEHIEAAENNPFAAMVSMPVEVEELLENPPSLPEPASYAWSYFMRLHGTRGQAGMGGFLSITYQEIYAFICVEQVYIEPWEVDLIKAFDREFLKIFAEQQEKEYKSSNNK